MKKKKRIPLGHVDVPSGKVAVFPTNHVFLTYTFDRREYWEALRLIVNVFVAEYRRQAPASRLRMVSGKITVETEYKHLFSDDIRRAKEQDIRMADGDEDVTFVEFHNAVSSPLAVGERSADYFAHGIIKCRGRKANQVWVLAETVDSLLKGASIKRYVLKDETGDDLHPVESGIMYVDLKKLARRNCPAGELASFLLGYRVGPKYGAVRKVARMIRKSFNKFRKEKEGNRMLNALEKTVEEAVIKAEAKAAARGEAKGEARGEARGRALGEAKKAEEMAKKLKELQQLGLDANEILRVLTEAFNAAGEAAKAGEP